LAELLVRAVVMQDVKVEFLNGEAAELLRKTGGLGGWLRANRASAGRLVFR
jgi:hypothetical protein